MSHEQGCEDDSLVIHRENGNTEQVNPSQEGTIRRLTLSEYIERLHLNRQNDQFVQSLTFSSEKQEESSSQSVIAKQPDENDNSTNQPRSVLSLTQYLETKKQQILEHEQSHFIRSSIAERRLSSRSNEYDDRIGETNIECSSAETHHSLVKPKEDVVRDKNDEQPKLITMTRYMELRQAGLLPTNLYSRQMWMTEEQRDEERFRQFRKEQARKLNQLRPCLSRSMNNLTITKELSNSSSSIQYLNIQSTGKHDTFNAQSLASPHPQSNLDQTASDTTRPKRRGRLTKLFSKPARLVRAQTSDDTADDPLATLEQRIGGRIRRFLFGDSVEDKTDTSSDFYSDP